MRSLGLLLTLLATARPLSPTWAAGSGWLCKCERVTGVFGVPVCVTTQAWTTSRTKCDHIVNVLAQLLDNDGDGQADDRAVVEHMASEKFVLFVPASEADSEASEAPDGKSQMTGIWEAVPNTCDTPSNRGASASDRSTWPAHVASTADEDGIACDESRDATTEEVLHLITEAAVALWPDKWGTDNYEDSDAGRAAAAANGDCGWGHSGSYKDPGATGACSGLYAYDDDTCDAACTIVEGIYWAIVTNMGGLYTVDRAKSSAREWLMCTPDDGMEAENSQYMQYSSKASTLQSGAPAFYKLVTDTTSVGHKWIPTTQPDGNYSGSALAEPPGMPGTCDASNKELLATILTLAVVLLVGAPVLFCIVPLMCSAESAKSRKNNRTRARPPSSKGRTLEHGEQGSELGNSATPRGPGPEEEGV